MLLCMRTTIDMPDVLYGRLKAKALERQSTMRDLLIQAAEAALEGSDHPPFRLRDASVGKPHRNRRKRIRPEDVNAVIDGMREQTFQ